jgi:fibrillarin-like pre-rRNA processing protein
MLAVKARCIDSAADPKRIFAQVERQLSEDFEIEERLDIGQFEKDHEFLLLKYKG